LALCLVPVGKSVAGLVCSGAYPHLLGFRWFIIFSSARLQELGGPTPLTCQNWFRAFLNVQGCSPSGLFKRRF